MPKHHSQICRYMKANGIRYSDTWQECMRFSHLLIHEYCVQHPHQWSNAVLCCDQWKPKSMYSNIRLCKSNGLFTIISKTKKNLILSVCVCNCVLRQRNHFESTKMLLISKWCWMLFELMIPFGMIIVYSTTIYHISFMKSWNLGKGKGKKATIIIIIGLSIIQNIMSV